MTVVTERMNPHPNWRLFPAAGFLGGYTTFLSFEYESFAASRAGIASTALVNVIASVVAGYVAVYGWEYWRP